MLLALIAQLGAGASVPRVDPVAAVAGMEAICHAAGESGGRPDQSPAHPPDCPACPLCVTLHTPSTPLVPAQAAPPRSAVLVVLRGELPPPSTAPPSPHRPPGQPRAPPTAS